MKRTVFMFSLLITPIVHAMRVAPAPIETPAQKGARFKKECAEHARIEVAGKQERKERASLRNADWGEEEINQLVEIEIREAVHERIKASLRDIFPESTLFPTPIALRERVDREVYPAIKKAEEDKAIQDAQRAAQAQQKCSFLSCFTACCG